jgi:hypothetical protein
MRHQDWQIRFEAFMRERWTAPFVWGMNDCCTFAVDCVIVLTGADPTPPGLRGHTTARQAYRAIQRSGGLYAIATSALGSPRPAAFAQVGDIVLAKAGARDMLAVCNGRQALAPSATGLLAVPLGDWCWRVD